MGKSYDLQRSTQLAAELADQLAREATPELSTRWLNAARMIPELAHAEVWYAEGWVALDGDVLEHGWLETRRSIVDPTLGARGAQAHYFRGLRYTIDEALERMGTTFPGEGLPGAWHSDAAAAGGGLHPDEDYQAAYRAAFEAAAGASYESYAASASAGLPSVGRTAAGSLRLSEPSSGLALEVGAYQRREVEDVSGSQNERQMLVQPPQTSMVQQLIAHLEQFASIPQPPLDPRDEAIAGVAVWLRWGTYFAWLIPNLPAWVQAEDPDMTLITQSEMARINIEASAALAEWIHLMRTNPARYAALAAAARRLPFPRLPCGRLPVSERDLRQTRAAYPEIRALVARMHDSTSVSDMRPVMQYADRVLANTIVDSCWRNGPIESAHQGNRIRPYPLHQRRLTDTQTYEVLLSVTAKFGVVLPVVKQMIAAVQARTAKSSVNPERAWAEEVLAGIACNGFGKLPKGWTLTESSREAFFPYSSW